MPSEVNSGTDLMPETLLGLGIIELYEADGRPTFIINLTIADGGLVPVFCNNALRGTQSLTATLLTGSTHDTTRHTRAAEYEGFLRWMRCSQDSIASHIFNGYTWVKFDLRNVWRVISGTPVCDTLSTSLKEMKIQSQCIHERIPISDPPKSNYNLDWTYSVPPSNLSSHVEFVRSIDWASTAVGSMETWPPLLRSMCNMVMADNDPAAIFWGDSHNMIYNEAFIEIAGTKHPALMGQHPAIPFAEIWDHFEGILEKCRATGRSIREDNVCLFIERHGYAEETYLSFAFTPLLGEDDVVVGNYHTVRETTSAIIAERRTAMLLRICQLTATAQNVKEYWSQVLLALDSNEQDVPLAALYSVKGSSGDDSSSLNHSRSMSYSSSGSHSSSPQECVLECSVGISPVALPVLVNLREEPSGLALCFQQALELRSSILISSGDASFDPIREVFPKSSDRGFGDPCKAAMVIPLHPTNEQNVVGFLLLGLNTRRPFDDDYKVFIEHLQRQLATSMASTVLYEDERKRGLMAARQARAYQAHLSAELSLRTEEIRRNEEKFAQLMKLAPVGVFIRKSSGHIVYCNDKWYDLMGYQRQDNGGLPRETVLKEAEEVTSSSQWIELITNKTSVTFETKLQKPPHSSAGNKEPGKDGSLWILTSAYPEMATDGTVSCVVGYITDISQQKWAEAVQQHLVKDAVESKRQQENFIDMTSHEIRNPLSAIMHSAEGIVDWLCDPRMQENTTTSDLVGNSIDAAQTVLYCAQHQKSIVDDILTLSKLDSKLLLITPVLARPVTVIKHAVKMFEAQFRTFDIECHIDNDLTDPDIGLAFLFDSSRLMQILINLITNAIKFTKNEKKRRITVSLGASLTCPTHSIHGIEYFPAETSFQIPNHISDVFLKFAITDTGCGLRPSEKERLFKRFSQATPRTYVQYGGTGLGLFICRKIIELQGGQIGVVSEPDEGSTFAFYITAQRPDPSSKITVVAVDGEEGLPDPESVIPGLNVPPGISLPDSSAIGKPEEAATTRNLNVLIVEDNLVNQRVLSKQLRSKYCTVGIANHGEEALAFVKETRHWKLNANDGKDLSVILMDIEMPVMDGLACTREIRRLQNEGLIVRNIPIIAVTANARKGQKDSILSAGMDRVISKPFRVVELLALINQTIDQLQS